MAERRKKVRVDERKNKVTVIFDTRFYEPESIRLSVNDFEGCCLLQMEPGDDEITVSLSPRSKGININTLGYEFYNHVLGRMRLDESRLI